MFLAGVVVRDKVVGMFGGNQLDVALGDDLHFLAQAGFQSVGLSKEAFAFIVAVDISMVEGSNAQVQTFMEEW